MNWDEYFFGLAKAVSLKATCPSRMVGSVIINPETKAVVSTGFNGAPMGTTHCGEACTRRKSGESYEKCKAVHAELNAITQAAKNGVSTNGMHMYLTTTPCIFCSRVLINAGIKKVYALSQYPQYEAMELLVEGGIEGIVMDDITVPVVYMPKED